MRKCLEKKSPTIILKSRRVENKAKTPPPRPPPNKNKNKQKKQQQSSWKFKKNSFKKSKIEKNKYMETLLNYLHTTL